MTRELSYIRVDQYLKSLSTLHVDIKDYCGTSAFELRERIASVDGLFSPAMIFFNYQGKLSGTTQRTFNTRTLSFSIMFFPVDASDPAAQQEAENTAEEIGLEVLSRIRIDSLNPEIAWLYNNLEKDSIRYEVAEAIGVDGFYGMEFHFDLKNLEPLVVTPEKWSDGNQFCTI